MNKKIASEIAVGIILLLIVIVGGLVWLSNKQQQEGQLQSKSTTIKSKNNSTVNTLQFYKEAKNLINSTDFRIKKASYDNFSASGTNYMGLAFVSPAEVWEFNYFYNDNEWSNKKFSIENYIKDDNDKTKSIEETFIASKYPEVPFSLIEFGAEGAYNKVVDDFKMMFEKNMELKSNYSVFTDYDKKLGWNWKLLFWGEKSSGKAASFNVTPEKAELISKAGIAE